MSQDDNENKAKNYTVNINVTLSDFSREKHEMQTTNVSCFPYYHVNKLTPRNSITPGTYSIETSYTKEIREIEPSL